MQSQQSQNWGSAALFYMPRSLKDSKLILFSLGKKKKSSSFSCERKEGGTQSLSFTVSLPPPVDFGSCPRVPNPWEAVHRRIFEMEL